MTYYFADVCSNGIKHLNLLLYKHFDLTPNGDWEFLDEFFSKVLDVSFFGRGAVVDEYLTTLRRKDIDVWFFPFESLQKIDSQCVASENFVAWDYPDPKHVSLHHIDVTKVSRLLLDKLVKEESFLGKLFLYYCMISLFLSSLEVGYEELDYSSVYEAFDLLKPQLIADRLTAEYNDTKTLKSVPNGINVHPISKDIVSILPSYLLEDNPNVILHNNNYYLTIDVEKAITAAGSVGQALERQDLQGGVTNSAKDREKSKKKDKEENDSTTKATEPSAIKGFTVPYGYRLRISSPTTGEEFVKEAGEQSGGHYSLEDIMSGVNPDWSLEQLEYQQEQPTTQQQQQQPTAGQQKTPLENTTQQPPTQTKGSKSNMTEEDKAKVLGRFNKKLERLTNLNREEMKEIRAGAPHGGLDIYFDTHLNMMLNEYDYDDEDSINWPIHEHFGTFENAVSHIVSQLAESLDHEVVSNPVEDELPDEQIPTINLDETPITKELLDKFKNPENARKLFAKMTSREITLAKELDALYNEGYQKLKDMGIMALFYGEGDELIDKINDISVAKDQALFVAYESFRNAIIDPQKESLIAYRDLDDDSNSIQLTRTQLRGATFTLSFFNCSHKVWAKIDLAEDRASSIHDSITLTETSTGETAAHEVAHTLMTKKDDRDSSLNNVFLHVLPFLHSRIKGNAVPVPIANMLPLSDYDENELVYVGNFIDPYTGKIYGRVKENSTFSSLKTSNIQDTEVITTGIQYMYQDPVTLAQVDPQHFKLIWSMRTQNTRLIPKQRGTL